VPVPSGPAAGRLPSLETLGLEQEVSEPLPGGEAAARKRLDAFLGSDLSDYSDNHDALGSDRTSRLSPYLHFGCISPRQVEERLPSRGKGLAAFHRQLCWRDFYHHVLFHFPRNARSEHQGRYRKIKWSYARKPFEAWCEGRTGYPLVDAGMRQLLAEGWMHNRARLVVGSFLTKDLGIDWRWGERHFMRYLIDGDEANNNGNWQWIASVGVDPQPYFRRIYNPTLHMERYDPEGAYVRKYVPELERVPDEHLREPWEMPEDVQEESGCVIGTDYPGPIVDHREARQEAMARYRSASGG
jgi:deoxyribodipyrimidine photo-lyase